MTPDEARLVIEKYLLKRSLNPAECIVLAQSWTNQTYQEMSKQSGYGDSHLKDTGYKLWRELSRTLDRRVTKKSLPFVLNHYVRTSLSWERPVLAPLESKHQLPAGSPLNLSFPSGAIAPNSALYIERPPCETLAWREMQQPGSLLRIRAPEKMGKSSLMLRLMQQAIELQYQIANVDLRTADRHTFRQLETFLQWLCLRVGQELDLQPRVEEYWHSAIANKINCEAYFQKYILKTLESPLALFFSSLEILLEYPEIAQDFLPMLRSWHEKAKWNPIWKNLRQIIVHSTEIYIPLNLHQSPLNVGQTIELPRFTKEQVRDLANRYGLNNLSNDGLDKLMELFGGHPYLTNVSFYYLVREEIRFENLIETATCPTGIYGDRLRHYLLLVRSQPKLLDALRQVIEAPYGVELDAVAAYELESLGLLKMQGCRAFFSCSLYAQYFRQQLDY